MPFQFGVNFLNKLPSTTKKLLNRVSLSLTKYAIAGTFDFCTKIFQKILKLLAYSRISQTVCSERD